MKILSKTIIVSLFWGLLFTLTSCGGCSKSGLKDRSFRNKENSSMNEDSNDIYSQSTTTITMEDNDGVKYIWVEINGLKLKFIFDTGASSICISSAEATVLYRQGTLKKEDILDVQYFQDATGNISAGTRINLRTVKIGERVLQNIEATVIDNVEAPLLLGQTALEEFGEISIDNKNNTITFKQ